MGEDSKIGEEAFLKAYNALNNAQKQAVDTIEGPVMVIAGPGTGKTQILALRIANILRTTDVPPSAILALTFTEAGVTSMRNRLVRLMGSRGYQVRIHTFHGFCNSIIRAYPERFPRIVGNEQLLEIDAFHILETILDGGKFPILRPVHYPYYYVRDIKYAISESKRENISPAELLERIEKEEADILGSDDLYHAKGAHAGKMKGKYSEQLERLKKTREFVTVYEAYEKEMSRLHVYDFEDTILEVVHTMERDQELTQILQEEHQYLLADEHQDANGAQNRLLELLAAFHESPNLFIVGDEKQAIYRFQGASLQNFLYFKEKYPDAVLIALMQNYRSTQVVLDVAHEVIGPSKDESVIARPRLRAEAGHPHVPVSLKISERYEDELQDMAETISSHLRDKKGEEVAVLCRRNSDVAVIVKVFQQNGIPVSAQNDGQILDTPFIRSFFDIVRAIAYFGDDTYLYPVLWGPFANIPNLDIYRLNTHTRDTSLWEVLSSEEKLQERGVTDIDSCVNLYRALDEVVTFTKSADLPSSIDFILARMRVTEYIAGSPLMQELLAAIQGVKKYIEQICHTHPEYRLKDLLQVLDSASEYRVSVMPASLELPGSVRVLTAHKSKGMEYDHVFIPFLHDGCWGARANRTKIYVPLYLGVPDEQEVWADEQRLLYVAMTRAKKTLTLSYAETGIENKEQTPSRFISDINTDSVVHTRTSSRRNLDGMFSDKTVNVSIKESEKEYLRARLMAQGLSVSGLNAFLDSPWKYFFQNLLRMPSRKENHQYYGTAMDAALKLVTNQEREKGEVSEKEILEEFTKMLTKMPVDPYERDFFYEKGARALSGYIAHYPVEEKRSVEAAVSFSVPFITGIPELPELTLRGEYDRVEFLDEHRIRVVDFKTGNTRTRSYIEGKTKDSKGHYKRQLVFYTLLATLDPLRQWTVEESVIDFVEPDDKGKYHRELFVITKEEVEELKELIKSTVKEILSFDFVSLPCEEEGWSKEGCALVDAFKKKIKEI